MIDADELRDLRAKAELLELLACATQDGIVDWNLVTNRAEYNPRWRMLLGFDDEGEFPERQDTPQLWQELVHPGDRDAMLSLLHDHLEQGWPFTTTVRMRHRCSGYRHILCRGTTHRDAEDRAVRMVIIFSDIDEKIRDQGRQRALVAALPDTLFRVRADGTISGVKHGIEREGSPFATLREDTTLEDCITDVRALARLRAALVADASSDQGASAVRIATVTASGAAIHHEVRIVRSGDDESVCIVRDVSKQHELEQRLLESQKLGAIGQLAAGVAHEINTPMQFIGDNLHFARGAICDLISLLERFKVATNEAADAPLARARLEELAAAEIDADFDYAREALPQALERSLTGVDRVTNIVRAMKAFAHPGADQLAPTDLKNLIESTVMVATNEWKYVADVELQLDGGLAHVPCVAGEINQVILNLIVNASHAIADVVGSSGEKGRITIGAANDETHAVIRIADTGTGIPDGARAKVFEPFFTTKEVGKGTGQGLSMAYNCIVKRHFGSIVFETELGVGTTFIIRLPLVAAPPVKSSAQA